MCQYLNIIRAGGRICHFIEMTFFLQQQLLIAGDTFREIIRRLIRHVKRRNRDTVRTGKGGSHCFRLRAKEIYMGIIQGQVPFRSLHMNSRFGSAGTEVSRLSVSRRNLCPQPPCGAKLGNFREIIRTHAVVKLYLPGYFVRCEAGIRQFGNDFIPPSQRIPQFLRNISTRVIEQTGIHGKHPILRQSLAGS
ncbi:hypothetical protein Barb6_03932 [Bacteroidales bacterium Barb6]|nr:hypothetical protein Barb6_03932 [Bacteroidales bacterium Barb6]